MTEIQGGRWDTLLRRLFPVKGPSIAPAIAPEIIPTVEVQPYFPEIHYLMRDRICQHGVNSTQAAANYTALQLENIATDHIIIIERVLVASDNAGLVYLGISTSGHTCGNAHNASPRDTRWPGGGVAPAVGWTIGRLFSGPIAAPLTSPTWVTRVQAGAPFVLVDHPIVLAPQHTLEVYHLTQNVALTASFAWRERVLEQSEY